MRANTSELEACSMPSPATVVNELLAQQAAEIATLRAKLESTQVRSVCALSSPTQLTRAWMQARE